MKKGKESKNIKKNNRYFVKTRTKPSAELVIVELKVVITNGKIIETKTNKYN